MIEVLCNALIRKRAVRLASGLAISLLLVSTAVAQLPIAKLNAIFPPGARQGTSVELAFEGGNLEEPTRLYFSHPAITSELLAAADGKPTRFKVNVPADVPLGWYDVRFVGKNGISNPRTFVVGEVEEVEEKEDNDTRATAMRVELNRVVNGRMKSAEDADWYVFSAKAGQRVLAEILAWRIDSKFDSYLTLCDSTGRVLQSSQDEAIRSEKTDSLIDFEVPADGDYYFKLTDFIYSGGGMEHFYRLQIGTQPLIDYVLPTGAKPGETTTFTVFGRNLPGGERTELKIGTHPLDKLVMPMVVPGDYAASLAIGDVRRPPMTRLDGVELRVRQPGATSNGRFVAVSPLPDLPEQEPNDTREQPQRLELPCAVSGQFATINDRDFYVFSAKKEQRYDIEVLAQRIASPVDPDLELLNAKGDVVHNAQDDGDNQAGIRFNTGGRDVRSEWQCPEDGDYTIRIEHLFGGQQFGPQFVYRLQVTPRTEDYRLFCIPPSENQRDSHLIEQGGRLRIDVMTWRLGGHREPITVTARNLPAGVTCEPVTIAAGMRWNALVLTAAADAPFTEAAIEIVGTSVCNGQPLEQIARGGSVVIDTGNTTAVARMNRSIMLAVRRQAPFIVTGSFDKTTVTQGEPLNLTMQVERKGAFANEIKITGSAIRLPDGMSIPVTSIPSSQNQATIPIDSLKLPPGTYSVVLSGEAQVPYEPPGNKQEARCLYPSNPISLIVQQKP